MIDTDKYEGHLASEGQTWAWSKWMLKNAETIEQHKATSALLNDAPKLLAEVKRLREALRIERRIVQAFYDYRDARCYEDCETWMLEKGHRVMVQYGDEEQSEWKAEVE
tara:strand:- start:1275 stop:1601 length:327 start_codon:yes stop_codon:yes gene_type:complete